MYVTARLLGVATWQVFLVMKTYLPLLIIKSAATSQVAAMYAANLRSLLF
jgi:hypothetical protein